MRIQHNIAALNSYRNLTTNNSAVSKNLEKLSSGYKINRTGDDAAGLAISEKMRAQITGLETAQKNANDGISLVQTAEGALTEGHSMLNCMVELADQSANGTYDDATDRANLQKEFEALTDEIDRISQATNFNGIQLLDGSMKGPTAAATLSGNITATPATTTTGSATATTEVEIDLTGMAADAVTTGGNLNINLGVGSVDVTVEAGETATSLADKIAAAATGKFTDGAGGVYTVTSDGAGTITITASGVGTDPTAIAFTATAQATADTGKDLTLQIGDTSDDFNRMTVSVGAMNSASLGLDRISIANQEDAADAVNVIKNAINMVSSTRGDLGAIQNRLEHTINNLSVTTENMTSAESRIRDVDMAEEMMAYTKNNILVQSSQAMLAQANQIPQGVLQLLQ
ncbi:MAG TPA: flagellin [Candidatus Mediterraneibacter norfolkensis]|nr:flagellin [Candidatus Mediterraneibacter norfolkensis]